MHTAVKRYQDVLRRQRRDALVLEHLDLVHQILGRMAVELPKAIDRENLKSAGMLGLVEAAGNFDETRGAPFRSFAQARIRGAILDELRRNCPLPQHMLQRWALIREAYARLESPVKVEEVAHYSGLTPAEVEECLAAIRTTQVDRWDEELLATRPDESCSIDPDEVADQEERTTLLADAIERLPERHRLVLTMYYRDELRLREIGEVLELSEGRVCRVLQEAEQKTREYVRMRTERAAG
jgi:RNA polymerase sigma factor for flagellar operon FliA